MGETLQSAIGRFAEGGSTIVPPDHSESSAALQDLRAEVVVISNAVNMLCDRVDNLSSQNMQGQLMEELGTIANVVNQLCDRVNASESVVPESPSPNRSMSESVLTDSRQHRSSVPSPIHACSDHKATDTTIYATAPASTDTSRDAGTRTTKPSGGSARTSGAGATGSLSSTPGRSQSRSNTARKAPDPSRWLTEPLSVSIARTDHSSVINSANFNVDRLMQRGAIQRR